MKSVDEMVEQMSLDEKLALIAGKDAWHISGVPSAGLSPVMITDGPHGLRKRQPRSAGIGSCDMLSSCMSYGIQLGRGGSVHGGTGAW